MRVGIVAPTLTLTPTPTRTLTPTLTLPPPLTLTLARSAARLGGATHARPRLRRRVVPPACSLPAGHSAPPFASSVARLPRSVAPDGYVTAFYYLLGVGALGVPLILAGLRALVRPCWSRPSTRTLAPTPNPNPNRNPKPKASPNQEAPERARARARGEVGAMHSRVATHRRGGPLRPPCHLSSATTGPGGLLRLRGRGGRQSNPNPNLDLDPNPYPTPALTLALNLTLALTQAWRAASLRGRRGLCRRAS